MTASGDFWNGINKITSDSFKTRTIYVGAMYVDCYRRLFTISVFIMYQRWKHSDSWLQITPRDRESQSDPHKNKFWGV